MISRTTLFRQETDATSSRTKPSFVPMAESATITNRQPSLAKKSVAYRRMGEDAQTVDFDLHGFVGIRLVGATMADLRAVERQLGPIRKELERPPDIVIKFVPKIESGPLRLLGVNDVAFSSKHFYVLRGAKKTAAKVRVPVEKIGQETVLLCESGLNAVPFLVAIINLTALQKGIVPLHAAGFSYQGRGVLCTGWSKGGKTETLLGFLANGAKYVGDEWVYLRERRMYGIPEPVHVWNWHLRELPMMRSRLAPRQRLKLSAARGATMAVSAVERNRLLPASVRDIARRISPAIWRQQHVKVTPERLFGPDAFQREAAIDDVFLVMSSEGSEYRVESVDGAEVAKRMVHSLQEERADLNSLHEKFRFAFPDKRNALIPEMEAMQRERLVALLGDRPAHVVYHPYPVCPVKLFDLLRPIIS